MISYSKIGNSLEIVYKANNFETGHTVLMQVMDMTDVDITGSPFTMTPIGGTGLYKASFIPSTTGIFKILVQEDGNSMATESLQIGNYDLDLIGSIVNGISLGTNSTGGYIP